MKTLQTLQTELRFMSEADKWFPVDRHHKFEEGDDVRTPDGEVKVVSVAGDGLSFYGEIITPIHDDVSKGETYEYRNYETTILARVKDKNLVRDKNVKKKRKKMKQKDKDDDLLMIDDVGGRHKSPAKFNPIIINPVMEVVEGVLDRKEIKDLTNISGNNIHEGSLTQTMIKGVALAVKRKAIVLGKQAQTEQDLEKKLDLVSQQVSAVAALTLLSVSVSGDGILSKAGVVSGLFS